MKNFIHFYLFIILFFSITSLRFLEEKQTLVKQKLDYKESTETLANPGMGYTHTEWIYSKPGSTSPRNPIGNLVLLFWDIGGFSSGKNGEKLEDGTYIEGTDYDFDEPFFNGLNKTLFNIRKNGGTIALRFRYDSDEKLNPEPKTFDKVLDHIRQIKDSKILEEYTDILMFVESGFVGEWGEQHSGKYTSLEYKAKLLDAVLDMVPDGIPVTVRTPDTAAKYFGVDIKDLDKFKAEKGSRFARVGIYNDGYMGSDYDLGTFRNREIETNWMNNQMKYTYYGGEFSSNINYAKQFPTYLPENSIPEMYKTHLTYINANIWNLYKDIFFTKNHTISGVDNSAYYGQSAFKFIRDHLGYRFVLRDSYISEKVKQGEKFEMKITIENTGFANPIKKQKVEILLEKNGNYMRTEIDVDSTEWYSAMKTKFNVTLKIPGSIEPGKWNVYLKLSVGKSSLTTYYMRSVMFANKDLFNPSIGANLLGSVEVTVSADKKLMTDDSFYQINPSKDLPKSSGVLLSMNNFHYTEGYTSNFEWQEKDLIMQVNQSKLYATTDDNHLYIMAYIPNDAGNPVVNMKLSVKDTSTNFWFYYQQGGNVELIHGDYYNMTWRYNGNKYEFSVPFDDTMQIHGGTILKYINVFVQDLSRDWLNVGGIESGPYQLKEDFSIYSAFRSVVINEGEKFEITADNVLDGPEYQWIKDDEYIQGANKKSYTIEKSTKNDIGLYSVKIRTKTGIEKIFEMCKIIDVY